MDNIFCPAEMAEMAEIFPLFRYFSVSSVIDKDNSQSEKLSENKRKRLCIPYQIVFLG